MRYHVSIERDLTPPPEAVARARDYIHAQLGSHLTLREIARAACLSPCHLARVFKSSVGVPPHTYVLQRRIDRARSLLVETNWPVKVIAARCGFASHSHFSTAFRSWVGVAPSAYRKRSPYERPTRAQPRLTESRDL